jgi:type IV pilus assembly protein PilA
MRKNTLGFTAGFSAVEMMVVMAVIVILAMIAVPSSLNRIIKEQVAATIPWADAAKEPIALQWKTLKTLPSNNEEVGLPAASKMVSNFVTSLEVKQGAIYITLGNKVHPNVAGKVLSIRPAVIDESSIVPITWVCGHAAAPSPMALKGDDLTTVPDEFLPLSCQLKK